MKIQEWLTSTILHWLCLCLLAWLTHNTFIWVLKRWRSHCYNVSCKKIIWCYEDSEIESLKRDAIVRMHLIDYEWCIFARLACEIRLKRLINE